MPPLSSCNLTFTRSFVVAVLAEDAKLFKTRPLITAHQFQFP
jgi:hypothetical protein